MADDLDTGSPAVARRIGVGPEHSESELASPELLEPETLEPKILEPEPEPSTGGRRRKSPRRLALAVVLFGFSLTALFTWLLWQSYNDNENSLLGAKAKEASAVVGGSAANIQTPLDAASELADASGGNRQQFVQFITPFVVGHGAQFVSATLWNLNNPQGPLATVGVAPELIHSPQAPAFFAAIGGSSQLNLLGLLGRSDPRIGYEFHPAARGPFAVYAEARLPADHKAQIAKNSAFSDLHYAIYFGRSTKPSQLLASDLNRPTRQGRHAAVVVPFGAGAFTIVVSPRTSLGGSLAGALPWIVAAFGTVITAVGALISARLQRRRREAERLASALNRAVTEARNLYSQQRSVAHHLERSLIPDRLPELEGLETACRYEPGATGVEIGGDWYDLVPISDDRAFFVVGDVSGRGIAAAAVMARLRFAVLAFVQVGFAPEAVLGELSNLISMEEVGHFATVVCGVIDLAKRELSLANAGHLPPLLLAGHETTFISEGVGIPIGVSDQTKYESVNMKVPPSATMLVYTDGLIERRTERIEAGLNRLAGTALQYRTLRLETQVNKIVEEMTRPGSEDDAALLAMRWQS